MVQLIPRASQTGSARLANGLAHEPSGTSERRLSLTIGVCGCLAYAELAANRISGGAVAVSAPKPSALGTTDTDRQTVRHLKQEAWRK